MNERGEREERGGIGVSLDCTQEGKRVP